MVSPGKNEHFKRLVTVLGCPAFAADERFLNNPLRVKSREEIAAVVTLELRKWHVQELAVALVVEGVPGASINDPAQVFDDAQVRHRQMEVSGAHALVDDPPMIANPIRFSATPISRYREPSVFGEHTDEILSARLGFDEAGIATLRQARVV